MINVGLLVLLVVVAVGTGVLLAFAGRVRRINRAYGELAARFDGQFAPAGLFRHPAVLLPYQGQCAWLGTEPDSLAPEGVVTVFRMNWPDSELQLQVLPRRTLAPLTGWLGNRRIKLGVPDFDRQFSVRCNEDPDRVKGILSTGVQFQLQQLARLSERRGTRLSIRDGQLTVSRRGGLDQLPQLARFATLGLELYEQAMLTNLAGIEIVSEQVAPHDEAVACRVCGDPLGADVVYCRTCRTPHHVDCWKYNASCSIYGCGETRYIKGRRAKRLIQPRAPDTDATAR